MADAGSDTRSWVPGHGLQVDVKFLERIGTRWRLFQFTAMDDCTRIRVLKIFDACTQRAAIQFINEGLVRVKITRVPSAHQSRGRQDVDYPASAEETGQSAGQTITVRL